MLATMRRLYAILETRERVRAFGVLALMVVGAALEACGLGLIMPFIALLNDPQIIERQPMLHWLYERLPVGSPRGFIIWMAGGLAVVYVVKNLYLAASYYLQYRFVYSGQVAQARRLFDAYIRSDYQFHLDRNSADLLRNIQNEVQMVYTNVLVQLLVLLSEALVVVFILPLLVVAASAKALFSVAVLAVLIFGLLRIFRRTLGTLGQRQQDDYGGMIKWVQQGLGGIKEIKVLGTESYFVDAYAHHGKRYARLQGLLLSINQIPRLLIETILVGGMLGVVMVMARQQTDLQSLFPPLALFAMASFRLLPSINRIVSSTVTIHYYRASVDVIYQDLQRLQEQRIVTTPATDAAPIPFTSELAVHNLTFQYANTAEPVLRDISVTVPKGSSLAIVGASGGGKTTLVDLMLGLLAPADGGIFVDGVDIRTNFRAWQAHVGYVPQLVYLADDTIRRNIAFGIPDAEISDEQIWSVLRATELEDLIRSRPEQLDTWIGERGVRLSGGQRQRIGIARVLYRDPSILILDEATASLDQDTEAAIVQTIEQLAGNKTVIAIAHRMSVVDKCDQMIVIDGGRIHERHVRKQDDPRRQYGQH